MPNIIDRDKYLFENGPMVIIDLVLFLIFNEKKSWDKANTIKAIVCAWLKESGYKDSPILNANRVKNPITNPLITKNNPMLPENKLSFGFLGG